MSLMDINEVIKASPAIQVQNKMTIVQRRAWNVLLANAYDELPNKEVHSINLTELVVKLGLDDNQTYLQEALKSLVDCTVEWNILRKDKKTEWGAASLLASAEIKDGVCFYQFPNVLRLKLHNPRVYAKLNLRLQNQFASQYALVLWEICFDYFDRLRNRGETPFIPLETFRELMGLETSEYPEFKHLNGVVIKPAINEINELTSYLVESEQKRVGRKVKFLKFRITRLKQITTDEQLDIHGLPPIALELVQADVGKDAALKIAQQEWDAVDTDALPPPGTYPDFDTYVDEKIWIARAAADVKNLGGFVMEAIRRNYKDPEAEKKREAEKQREQEALLEALKAERIEKEGVLLKQAVRLNPELLEKAAEKLAPFPRQRLEDFDSVEAAYHAGGLVAGSINSILAEEYCADLLAPVYQAYEDERAKILGK